jgi:DNA replication protein DnaC
MDKQTRIEKIEELLKSGTLDDTQKAVLMKQLSTLQGSSAPVATSGNAMQSLNTLANLLAQEAGLDEDEVRRIAEQTFGQSQITLNQLSPEVKDFIDKTKTTTITVLNVQSPTQQKATTSQTSKQRALYYVILSDFAAKNNVYLYGPAGTGKTYIAKEVAKAVGYKTITINCNQFTAPLEIIGGQTIDGYQEGKLIQAWGNLDLGINPRTNQPYEGALLLIDELPKLDPNTAGVMNDALSAVKDPDEVSNGKVIPKNIFNGRNEAIALKNFFAIGTGNTLLLRPDPNYTANFAQDASLQDRFAGSTYRVFYDYEMEYEKVLTIRDKKINGTEYSEVNMAFLFVFLIQFREAVDRLGYNNEAFVSARIMGNLRDTYLAYRINELASDPNQRPKTLQDGIASFMSLFTDVQQTNIKGEIPYDDFMDTTIPEANTRPLGELSTDNQKDEAQRIVDNFKATFGDRIL